MKSLLILLAIYIAEVVIQKIRKSKQEKEERAQQQEVPPPPAPQDSPESGRSLQDLIRQFENAQQQASQGNIEPPLPPEEEGYDDDEEEYEDVDLPVVEPAQPGSYTFQEIAESVIQWEFVSEDLLQQAFSFSAATAQRVLTELQEKRIVGRDMGEGECDLLVHDKVELANHLKRLQREAEEQQAQQALQQRREEELQHQRSLAELEERARKMREESTGVSESDTSDDPCTASAEHARHKRTFDKSEIRRGFVWAKVLDEPRFKKRWSSRVR